jgi:hypothetical protein
MDVMAFKLPVDEDSAGAGEAAHRVATSPRVTAAAGTTLRDERVMERDTTDLRQA